MPSPGPRLSFALQLWQSPACLPASSGGWAGPQAASSPMVFAQSFVLWAGLAVPQVRAFHRNVLSLSLSSFFFFSLSLAVLWFGLISHVSSFRLPSGHSGLVLTLSNAALSSLVSPRLLVMDARVWATSLLGVAVRLVICGFIYLFFPPGYVALWDSKTPQTPTSERVSWCLETSLLWLHPWDGSPSLALLSLFLSFIFCPTSFWRQWAAFLGAWCPLPAFRSCFVEFAQRSNYLSMNLLGRKWSPRSFPPPS